LKSLTKKKEQAYFLVQTDILSVKMMHYLETIVNCRVLVEDHRQNDDKFEGKVQMVLSKNSGFSYFEVQQKIFFSKLFRII